MQTAVEYIFQQLEEQGLIFLTTKTNEMTISISASDYLDIKRLSKEMEKQQIKDAYWGGLNGSINDYSESKQVGSEIIDIKYGKGADQYYNETYGSKGSDETLKENHIVDTNEMVEDTFKVWECCGMEECICKGSNETKTN